MIDSAPHHPTFDATFYFHPIDWFHQRYHRLPYRIIFSLSRLDALRSFERQLLERYPNLPQEALVRTEYFAEKLPEGVPHWGAYEIKPGLLVYFGTRSDYNFGDVQVLYHPSMVESFTQELEDTKQMLLALLPTPEEKPQAHSEIMVLNSGPGGMNFTTMPIKKMEGADLSQHYNDDLQPHHELIVRRLRADADKGIIILYGQPGTGKTSYIRLLCALTEKRKLYIPSNLAPQIADPAFMQLLLKYPNSILLIEDAEQVLRPREESMVGNNAVSNLLNIADGLLSDAFNMQIICTFNTKLDRVDSALLRKGRLITAYEFGPLELPKAKSLAYTLNLGQEVTEATTLAELYSYTPQETEGESTLTKRKPPKIGFGAK